MSSYVNFTVWIETEFLPYLLVAVCIVSTIISLVLNTALIMTLKKRNILCTPYGQFFLQFTILDFLACLTILIPTCVVAIMMSWELTAYSCYAQGVFANLLYLNNFTIISFLVIERSVKVKNMELHKILFEPKRKTILLSVFIWIINIGISLIPLSDWVEVSYHTYHAACVVRLSKSMYYLVAVFSVGIGISFCVGICTCPSILYKRAKEIRQRVNDSGIKEDYMSNKNTTNNTNHHSNTSNVLGSGNIKQDNRNEKPGYQSHLRLPSRLQTAKQKFKAAADISKILCVSDYTEDFRFASTVFIIWVVLIVCWLPYFVVAFYDSLHSDLWNGFYTVTLIVALPSYCIKPLIFVTYNRNTSSSGEQTHQSNRQSTKAKSFRRVVDKLDRLVFMSVKRQRTVDTIKHVQTEMKTKNPNYTAMKDSTSGKLTSVSAISNRSDSDRNISHRQESRKNTINNRRDSKNSQNPKKKANSLSKTVPDGKVSNDFKSERTVSTDDDKSNSFYDVHNDVHKRMPSNKRTDVNVNVRKIQVKPENSEKGRTENGCKELDSGTSGIGGYSFGLGNDQQNEKRIEVIRRENPTSDKSYENHAAYRPKENMQGTVIVNQHRSDHVARTTTNFVKETKVRQSSGNFSENPNSHKQHSSHEVSYTKGIVAVKAYDEILDSVANQSLNNSKSDNEQFNNENDTTDGSTLKVKLNKHETVLSHRTHENRCETLSHLTPRKEVTNAQFSKNNALETNKTRKHETYHDEFRNSSSTILVSGTFTNHQTNNKKASIIQRDKNSMKKTEDINKINMTGFEADHEGDKYSNSEFKGNKSESTKRTSISLSNKSIDENIQTQTVPISNKLTENTKYYTTPTTNKRSKETKYHNALTNKSVEEIKYHTASTTNKIVEETKHRVASTNKGVKEANNHIVSTLNKNVEETKYHTAPTTNKGVEEAKYRTATTTNKSVEDTKHHTAPTTNKSVQETNYHTALTTNKGFEETKYRTATTTNKGFEETKFRAAPTTNNSFEESKYNTAPTATTNKGVEETKYSTAATTNKSVEEAKYHTDPTTNKKVEETKYRTVTTTNKSVEEAKYHTTPTKNKNVEESKHNTVPTATTNNGDEKAKFHTAPTTNKGTEEAKYHTAPTTNTSVEETTYNTAPTATVYKGIEEAKHHTAPTATTNKGVEEDKYRVASTTNTNVEETKYHTAPKTSKGIGETKYRTTTTTNKSVDDTKYHTTPTTNQRLETRYYTPLTTIKNVEETKYRKAPTSITKQYPSNRNASTTITKATKTEKSIEKYIVTAEANIEQSTKRNRMALGSTGNDSYSSLIYKPVNIVEGKIVEYSDRKINIHAPTAEDSTVSNKGTLHYRNEVSRSEMENTFSKYGNQNLYHSDTTFQNQNYDTRIQTRSNFEKDLLSSEYSFKPESSGGTRLGPFPVTTSQKQNYDTRMKTFLKRNKSEKVLPLSDYSNPESSAIGGKLSGQFPYDIPVHKAPLRNTVTLHIDNGSMDKALLRDIAKDKSKISNKHPYGIYNSIHGDNNHFC